MLSSVIITTYKRPVFLLRAIESVLTQTIPAEIIIVDDNGIGSEYQKKTEELLSVFSEHIVYIPLEKNSGACVARNRGVEIAKGEYIFFLDDDDEFLSDKVDVQSKFLDNHPAYDGCLSAFRRLKSDGKEILAESNYPLVGSFNDFVIKGNFFTPMLAIRKSSFLQVGGFTEIPRFQDRFFLLHCLQNGMKFKEIQEQLYIMYEHAGERITHKNVTASILALNILKDFIDHHKADLTVAEYSGFLQKDFRMRATIYYVSEYYITRLQAVPYYLKAFTHSLELKDIISLLKTMLKYKINK